MSKRDRRYVNKGVINRGSYGTVCPLTQREIPKDMTYNLGQESFYDMGTLLFLNLLGSLNKLSPSLVTILFGGGK